MAPEITIHRRIQWLDTDAAGIWHHTTLWRLVEEAEAELHRGLGIIEKTFGATPRVHLEADFAAVLHFDDDVALTLRVEALGETSVTYRFWAKREEDVIASGSLVAVFIDRNTGRSQPWTEELRGRLDPA